MDYSFLTLAFLFGWFVYFLVQTAKKNQEAAYKKALEKKGVEISWSKRAFDLGLKVRVFAPLPSKFVLDTAKAIVDDKLPQKFGPWGTPHYSNKGREAVLNILLWFFDEWGRFPEGHFALGTDWPITNKGVNPSDWLTWKGEITDYKPSRWIKIPPLPAETVKKCREDWEKKHKH